jgi:hypothetical protein
MARLPRWIPDNALVEVSSRCFQGRFLLRPSDELNSVIIGVLGRALELFPVDLHAAAFLSNHYHLLATFPSTGVMSRFMAFVNRNLSIEVGKLHDWRGPMWEGRYNHSILDNATAVQITRLRYLLSQGSKEGLVLSPRDWPGVHCAKPLIDNQPLQGLWIDRTAVWAAKNRREPFDPKKHTRETSVYFQPLPCWSHLPPEDCSWRVQELIEEIERETASEHARHGTLPIGVQEVLKHSPHHRPRKVKWSPAPRVMAATRDARWALWRALQSVVVAYWHAAEMLAEGAQNVPFPPGTFPPRRPYVPSSADLKLGIP